MSKLVKGIDELSPLYRCGYQQGKADAVDEIHTDLMTEIAMLNETDMTDVNLYTFAVRIKEITDKLISR